MAGAALLALTLLPVHRLLRGRQAEVASHDLLGAADRAYDIMLLGAAIVLTVAVLASRMISWEMVNGWLQRIARALTAPSRAKFAAGAGILCTILTGLFALLVLDGKPNLMDAMVQLLHARFVAEGALAGPTVVPTSFWHMQNSVITDWGWVSHFPPGYPVLLAIGHLLGMPWLISALMAGMAVFFTALAAEYLLPERKAAVRAGVLLAAQSPFLIGLAGAQMNHVGAAAFIALAMYAAVRGAASPGAGWALLSGAALGAAFTIRPFAAVVGAVPALAIAIQARDRGEWKRPALRVAYGLLGALPLGIALAWYNARFFGSALRFGYEYSYGPSVGLGFHRDPWGNQFGPLEAVAYTASDLTTLGQNLLETPLSAVAIVGLYLLIARRLTFGEKILAGWALLPLVANFFYWHHGIFMGPRMLNEVAAVWCVLVAVSAAGVVRCLSPEANFHGYYARTTAAVAAVATFAAGAFYLAPERMLAYGTFMPSSRIPPPEAPDSSLVFVHGAWTSRIAMRLAAAGMRLDSIETAMRHNQTCDVDAFSRLYGRRLDQRPAGLPNLDFNVGIPRELPYETVRGEYTIRPGSGPMPAACARELHADRLGTLDAMPMLWQVRVPGLHSGGAIVVRDMGPEENAELIAAYPTLMPLMYYRPSPAEEPILVPYAQGASLLWSDGLTGYLPSVP
ncbi:hypothetical protein BH23GEM2_BH23GEM2_03490 [soil metagenome]